MLVASRSLQLRAFSMETGTFSRIFKVRMAVVILVKDSI
jgi:hypothetical protein